ncbi:hypothetical protein evm_013084 [Chilo suppressalis]|nr:hypothetical protein evm_013084 [Chilo suppressalis]
MGSPPPPPPNGAIAFTLVYFTFFLDNVLLTVLVPIIPDWVRGESLALWSQHDTPLVALLNETVRRATDDSPGSGGMQAVVGLVLGAKAGAQLVAAPLCSACVCRRGPAPVLRAATALLAVAAASTYTDYMPPPVRILTTCSACVCRRGPAPVLRVATALLAVAAASTYTDYMPPPVPLGVCGAVGGAAWCAGVGRAAQGAGAAGAGVAGLALAAIATTPDHRQRALGALLGAVALGVLVGYPFGGMANALWSRPVPFLLIAAALIADLVMQNMFLDREEFRQRRSCEPHSLGLAGAGWRGVGSARRGAGGACAGAVLLTTTVMAALEPCLPLYLADKFHPQRWQMGLVFVPDSFGYLVAASLAGGAARRLGAERVALAAQATVALAALAVPHAPDVSYL